MRRAEKPFVEGDYKITKTEDYSGDSWWIVSQYRRFLGELGWTEFNRFKYRWQARRWVRKQIKQDNRPPRAHDPEYWRA